MELNFRKSSFSGGSDQCVEVAVDESGLRRVRDSKDPAGAVLTFTPGEWAAFAAGMRAGEFDQA